MPFDVQGSKIFCLHYVSMQTIDVPQSASMYRYLEKKVRACVSEPTCIWCILMWVLGLACVRAGKDQVAGTLCLYLGALIVHRLTVGIWTSPHTHKQSHTRTHTHIKQANPNSHSRG